MRAGSFRHTPDLEQLTPFPVPWSYPSKDEEVERPKYPKFKNRPFPADQYRFQAPTFDPFPHKKNPDVKTVPKANQTTITKQKARLLKQQRMFITINGVTVVARLLLRPGEKLGESNNVYIAKVLSAKQSGTGYPVYILRIQPDAPQHPGKKATGEEAEHYNRELLKWQYKFDRAAYWDTVRFMKQQQADIVEAARAAWEKQLERAKRKYYRDQAKARIEYERQVSEAKAKYKEALREWQISKIGSYYGNKYFSLYGSYYD